MAGDLFMSIFSNAAAEAHKNLSIERTASVDKDAEWHRVNSLIADILKDAHMMYAKLARLQGDFIGEELTKVEEISESILTIGEQLSHFSRAFYEGKFSMAETEFSYGTPSPNGESQEQPPEVIVEEEVPESESGFDVESDGQQEDSGNQEQQTKE
jgi:hypothetical protein